MVDPLAVLARYLASHPREGWHWVDDGRVLAFRDGRTIAFRAQVDAVLLHVIATLDGVPPFRVVVFLLAAMRNTPPGMAGVLDALGGDGRFAFDQFRADLEAAGRSLTSIPTAFWRRADAAPVLVAAVSSAAGVRRQPDVAALLRDALERGGGAVELQAGQEGDLARGWLGAIPVLTTGLARLADVDLERRAITGIVSPPVAADLELPIAERVRRLIEQVGVDPELGPVAHLAREVMAAVRLPRPALSPAEEPIGGVAGLSNRGPLDRLLTTELAQDDLTLAVRIALNEALFLRRDPPQQAPDGARLLLIDDGIRMWGVTRLFAAAVALALGATTARRSSLEVFRPEGDRLCAVDLTSRQGLDDLLGALGGSVTPERVIPAFVQAIDRSAEQVETVLVTHPDCLADATFADSLAQLAMRGVHVVTIDSSGELTLIALTPRGRSRLHGSRLDLTRVAPPSVAEPEPLRDEDPDIAAIDRVVPFPLRLPAAGLARLVVQLGEDVVGVARDRRLLRWCGVGGGARQLLDQLPPGRVLLVEAVDDVLHVAVGPIGSRGPIWIRRDLRTEVAEIDRLPDELSAVSCIALSGGVLIVFQRPDVVCFEPRRPDALHRMRLPDGFAWLGRGYFRSRRGVRQLVLTNNGPIFERVSSDVDAVRIATAVDSDKSHCEAVRRGPTPRWRFKAIGQTVDGKLALVGSLETLALVVSHERFAWHRLRSAAALIGVQHFTRGRGWGGIRRSRARWPDGRRATVDSRGLLHLQQGGDPSELSIVLSSWGPTAAWTVGGGCIGDRRFIDGEASAELFDTVDERIRRFIGGAS